MPIRALVAGLSVLALGSGTACSATPSALPTPTPSVKPALTAPTTPAAPRAAISVPAAQQELQRFVAVRNRAETTYDDSLVRTVAAGSLLTQRLAAHKVNRVLKRKPRPLALDVPFVGTTPAATYPMRFITEAPSSSPGGNIVGLAERRTAGSPWRWTYSLNLGWESIGQSLGGPDGRSLENSSSLRPAAQADFDRLTATPTKAVAILCRYLSSGTTASVGKRLAFSGSARQYTEYYRGRIAPAAKSGDLARDTVAVPVGKPVALHTASGVDLVFVTVKVVYVMTVPANRRSRWTGGAAFALAPKGHGYRNFLTATELLQVVLVLPPKGQGVSRVVGIEAQTVAARGS
ncbi:hypothetical protein [Kribbella deserti]|uniref:DUF8094 domain-containing protein n=1 Tax=Kribbella deserti TaxID=1926257 RepID=A0ABV6QJI7_9ACTN